MPATWVFHTCKPLLCFPNSAAQDSADFANKKLESFLDGLLLSKSYCLFFSFNCQKMKESFISPETSRKHPFWVFLFLLFHPKWGISIAAVSWPIFLSRRHRLRWSYLPRGCLRISTLNSITLLQKYHWRPSQSITWQKTRNALTSAVFPFILRCSTSSENQGN